MLAAAPTNTIPDPARNIHIEFPNSIAGIAVPQQNNVNNIFCLLVKSK
jgi:hypothetical protein